MGACDEKEKTKQLKMLTKLDFFNDGLSGGEGSSEKRRILAAALGFPSDMSASALVEAINLTIGYDGYKELFSRLFKTDR